jgi:nucleotide-binding universal stress UspA family protein
MIRLKKILLPTDLSEYSRHALPYALELARSYGATLHLVHVVEAQWAGPLASAEFPGQVEDALKYNREAGEKALRKMKEDIKEVAVETHVLVGAPHVEIVRLARREKMDLVVLATHGRTGLAHALIGSVAEKVVQMAPCPVLSIKNPEHEFVLP